MKSDRIKDRFFLDTNVIIYSFDGEAPKKKKTSLDFIARALSSGLGVISHQVVQEFVSVANSRFMRSFDRARLILYLEEVMFAMWKAYPSREMYIQALQIKEEFNFSWWDSLIAASALETGCRYLISENFQHEQKIYSLKIVNPYV